MILPNTKIEVQIPLMLYTLDLYPITEIGRSFMPDYDVELSINDEVKGIDAALNFTLD